MKSLLAFGEALIDLLQDPANPGLYHRNAGGAPANVAVGFARLEGRAAFMGMLGKDGFGEFLLGQLQHYGVDTRHAPRTSAATTALAVVSLAADGDRSFSFYRPPSADLLMAPGDVDPAAFTDRPYFHFCSNSLTHQPSRGATLRALELAHASGCLISFDINWRPSLWPAGEDPRVLVRALLPRAHVLKFSAEEWEWLCEGSTPKHLAASCFAGVCELVIITDGGAPARTITRRGIASVHPVAPCAVIDSTAAGDAFIAALLRRFALHDVEAERLGEALADQAWLARQMAFATRCGSLACTRYGAFSSLPTMAQLRREEAPPDALAANG